MRVSYDNKEAGSDYWAKQYMVPTGENGKHARYGAFVRDRPLARSPRTGDFRTADAQDEIRQAIAGGIDGFTLDLVSVPATGTNGVWDQGLYLLRAAAAVDPKFKIMLMPDMASNAQNLSREALSDRLAELAKYPAAYRLADGRLVISPFKAESKSVSWWKQFMSVMKTRHGIDVAFVPVFLDERAYVTDYSPMSYGISYWGARNPLWTTPDPTVVTSPVRRAQAVVNSGKVWMHPVAVQDARPNGAIYEEAQNTTTLRNSWETARTSGAQWVQLTTWNDYTEGTQFAPSAHHGWSYLDITAFYAAWFKTGVKPTVTKDVVHVTHRIQPYAATPTYPQTLLMKFRAGTPPVNTVEALTFLTAPGKVVVTSGANSATCDVPAGVGTCSVALGIGTVTAVVNRGGAAAVSVTSPFKVVSRPYLQDLEYYAASSAKTTTTAVEPPPTSAPPSANASVVHIRDNADGYVNGTTQAVNLTGSSLDSRSAPSVTSYLRFTLPLLPAGKTLTRAVLRVHTNTDGKSGSVASHKISLARPWSGSTLTWASRPALSDTVLGLIPGGTRPATSYDVKLDTAAVAKLVGTSATFAIGSSSSDGLSIWSGNFADTAKHPTLVLTYS